MPQPTNDGNIVKRTSQYLDNIEHDETTGSKGMTLYGTTDGVNIYRVAVGPNGELISSSANLATRLDDYTTASVTYVGKAAIGSGVASAVWQISKIDETSGVVITWADGNANFDNIWDNRASLTYS